MGGHVSARGLGALVDAGAPGGLPRPVYRSLADRIRLLVLDGRLPAGTRLPAERDLAAGLGLSRTTVAGTYGALRDAGFLESRRGSGSVVVLPPQPPPAGGRVPGDGVLPLDFAKAPCPPGPASPRRRSAPPADSRPTSPAPATTSSACPT
jgi:DNA-binding transcriptional MocR family regulator